MFRLCYSFGTFNTGCGGSCLCPCLGLVGLGLCVGLVTGFIVDPCVGFGGLGLQLHVGIVTGDIERVQLGLGLGLGSVTGYRERALVNI